MQRRIQVCAIGLKISLRFQVVVTVVVFDVNKEFDKAHNFTSKCSFVLVPLRLSIACHLDIAISNLRIGQ